MQRVRKRTVCLSGGRTAVHNRAVHRVRKRTVSLQGGRAAAHNKAAVGIYFLTIGQRGRLLLEDGIRKYAIFL